LTKVTRRREFLKFAGLSAFGLSVSQTVLTHPLLNAKSSNLLVYVGTYTTGTKSQGIYLCRLDVVSGELTHVATTSGVADPSFLTVSSNRRFLYAVNELEEFEGKKSGAVSAFEVDQHNGSLRLLNQQPSLGGSPCYVELDSKGKFLLVANYGGGNLTVLPVKRDGSLESPSDMKQHQGSGVNKERQEGPHAHCVMLDQANKFAYSCDLGTDKVMIYRFDSAHGKLVPNDQPWASVSSGAGPRHLAFHPNGRYIFVLNEMNSTITVFGRDPQKGSLKELQTTSTLPVDFKGSNSGADIHVSPNGRFLYSSNRGHDSIAVFKVDSNNGSLITVGHESTQGMTPRNFAIDPSGKLLLAANQKSDNIVTFKIDDTSGQLKPTGHSIDVPAPVCLKLIPPFS